MKIYTKEQIIERLKEVRSLGWVANARPGNAGGVGNTLEDLLGIEENNLPMPNAAEWELKCQRMETSSLTTLFHSEPSPRAIRFVPNMLLPNYGWQHKEAGARYPADERSFRQTITGTVRSSRGFKVVVDRKHRKVLVSFDAAVVSAQHSDWLNEVKDRVGLGELSPQPYWGFDDLEHIAGTKLLNCFYLLARTKREEGKQFFRYEKILVLTEFSIAGFIKALEDGIVYVDFDARTHHNHGTKFRLRQGNHPSLYNSIKEI